MMSSAVTWRSTPVGIIGRATGTSCGAAMPRYRRARYRCAGCWPCCATDRRRDLSTPRKEACPVDFARYDAELARRHIPDFLELYADVYGVAPYLGDPFFAVGTYAARLDGALA